MNRKRRISELDGSVLQVLEQLGLPHDAPAFDAWLDPHALSQALSNGSKVLLRVGGELGATQNGYAQAPAESLFMLLRKDRTVALCRMDSTPVDFAATEVRLDADEEPCCDSPKCHATRVIHQLVLESSEGSRLLIGEALEPVGLTRVALALGNRLDVPVVGADVPPAGDATPAPALRASALARWALRREGDLFVVRDNASRGPREAMLREWLGTAVLAVGAVAHWVFAATAYQNRDNESLAIAAAIAVVLTLAAFATSRIATHSGRYRAKSEALLYASRDRLVVAPWHSRDGAVDLKPEGRYGAALRIADLDGIEIVPNDDGFTLRALSSHGPYDIGTLETEEQARTWRGVVLRLLERVSHHAALAVVTLMLVACGPHGAGPSAQPGPTPLAPSAPVSGGAVLSPSTATPSPSASSPVLAPSATALVMIEDDIPAALALAKESHRAVFVEVWAPWCHTCLSMKNFVLPDPSVTALEDRVVFAAVDSDRPENAAFMDRYAVNVWPTLFVLDATGKVMSLWQGAASKKELREFIQSAVDEGDAKLDPKGPLAAMLEAKRAHAAARWKDAAASYQRAIDRGGPGWARRSEALAGLVFSTYRRGDWASCTQLGIDYVAEIEGAAVPADFAWVMLDCADEVKDAALAQEARKRALVRLQKHTESPPPDSSVDDRSDALAIYASALTKSGDRKGARAATLQQLAILEAAADRAPGPKEASTFDYARMGAYLATQQGDKAVALLTQRVRELPDSYEPPARLAQALMSLDRLDEARAPMADAVAKSYGPRKLRYLSTQADLFRRLRDPAGEKEALTQLVAGYDAATPAQRQHPPTKSLAEAAKKRLQAL